MQNTSIVTKTVFRHPSFSFVRSNATTLDSPSGGSIGVAKGGGDRRIGRLSGAVIEAGRRGKGYHDFSIYIYISFFQREGPYSCFFVFVNRWITSALLSTRPRFSQCVYCTAKYCVNHTCVSRFVPILGVGAARWVCCISGNRHFCSPAVPQKNTIIGRHRTTTN